MVYEWLVAMEAMVVISMVNGKEWLVANDSIESNRRGTIVSNPRGTIFDA